MVLYQHKTNRSNKEWIKPKLNEFEQCLKLEPGAILIGRTPGVVSDVAFFIIEK